MNTIIINIKVKQKIEDKQLVLYNKTYLTSNGIINHWFSSPDCKYRLEVMIEDSDLSVNPSKIAKDMNIITDEWEIADQIMQKLYRKGVLQN